MTCADAMGDPDDMIHVLRVTATPDQLRDMLTALETYIKLTVDVHRGVAAGGGVMHADCEAALLEDGSRREDVWGADWDPVVRIVAFEALTNLRPGQGNRSLRIEDRALRDRVEEIVRTLLGESP